MNTTLWIIQGIVATALIASGLIILLVNKEKLATKLSWINAYSNGMRYFICISKILGGIGLILPMYFDTITILTPIAACCIALFMLMAMRYHLSKKEYKDLPATLIFFTLALIIMYFRF
jgi:uncharacterized membrane protein